MMSEKWLSVSYQHILRIDPSIIQSQHFKEFLLILNNYLNTLLIPLLQKMFKKPIKLGGQNQLSGKDKKTIKNKLSSQFDPETVEKLFAANDKIICNKISGSKMLIYVSDQYPLFVDGTGKEQYFLSVYTGAAYEPLSKRLFINEGVQGYIFNGANLMWPGVKDLSRLGNFKKDQIVSIVNSANEVIAIGAMGCSLDELKANTDGSGIAVYILHYRGDKLWDLGNKTYPQVIVKAKEEKIEVKVEEAPKPQSKVQVKPIIKKEQKPQSDQEQQVQEPAKDKGKGKKDKRVSFNQEETVSEIAPAKGKGKKQKKKQSDEQEPEQPAKGKNKGGKKDKKVDSDEQEHEQQPKGKGKAGKKEKKDSDEEKPQQPAKGKGKGKKEKKQQSDEQKIEEHPKGKGKKEKKPESDEQKIEEAPKGKGKGKKQTKQEKAPAKKKVEQEQSDDDVDFGNLIHEKQPQRSKVEKKVVVVFSDQQDDKKGKKKGGRKGGNKKKESDDEAAQPEHPKPKQQHKGKKTIEEGSDEEKQVKKNQKKGKNKKAESDQEQHQQQKEEKKKGKKDKRRKEESDEEEEQQIKQQKPAKVEEGQQQNDQGAKSAINSQLMDEYFKEAFLNVLKLSKVQGQLPIDSGRFFSDYMILARPEGVKLEIKDTSYKKLGKFYEQMAKKKFIQFKPAKEKKGQQGSTISKIFWQNEELKNYFPTIRKMGDKDVQQKVEQYSKQKLKLTKTLEVQYVYKLNDDLKKVLMKKVINYMPDKSDDEQKQEKKETFFSEKQLKEKIEKYINEIALKDSKQAKQPKEGKQVKQAKQGKDKEKKTDKIVTLNYKENEFIYGLLKKEIQEYEQNLEKEEMLVQQDSDEQEKKKSKKDKNKKSLFRIQRGLLVNKIMKLASPYYNMSDKSTGLNKFKQGTFKGIQLIADKVINKNVTKIIGIETFAPSNVEPEELVKQIHGFAHQLQVKFASSATVQNLPGKNAGKQIVVQGNFVDELEAIFTSEFGIKKDYITIQNKLGKKKKN